MTLSHFIAQLSIPVIAAPMFLVSGAEMVVEACKAGICGTFPSLNARTSKDFEQLLQEIEKELKRFEEETNTKPAPYGVNLIVNRTNPRLSQDLEICIRHKVPLIITSLGAVKEVVESVHAYGGLVFHDVIKKRHAEKAAAAGVDGIIAVAAGAGGHAGTTSPFALLKEIRQVFKGTLILAGGMTSGQDVLAAQLMGADLAYLGTRFIATKESKASTAYKKLLTQIGVDDLIYTDAISGVHANFIKPSILKAGIDLHQKTKEDFSQLHTHHGKAWKDIWSAGHGATAIDKIQSVAEIVNELKSEYKKGLEKIQAMPDFKTKF